MVDISLESEIIELIKLKAEGEYWDFKQKWQSNNCDLIHDIICMANSSANRDCYIIIGIEDENYGIMGVNAECRKNQQNVIDLLRQKPKWAGGHIPEVYVKTVFLEDKEIDVITIKRSDNTPFYLLEDYKNGGSPIFKGSIYLRKGDTNTPKTSTADIHDTEILWKRRFGLLYHPSQRAKHYLKDCENWEMVDGDVDKFGVSRFFYYYRPDPDYTVHFIHEEYEENDTYKTPSDINDSLVGISSYYLFAFCNVSYHTNFSNSEVVRLFYKEVPLFSGFLESIDEGRIQVLPPEFSEIEGYYIEESFQFLMFEFVFAHRCGSYSSEAKEMIRRVIPVYHTETEHEEFVKYTRDRGFGKYKMLGEGIDGEAQERLNKTDIGIYQGYGIPGDAEITARELNENSNLVINFACLKNIEYDRILERLRRGKMLVNWLEEWRNAEEI